MSEFQISSPPKDGISQVSFSPCHDHLLATSSWDKGVRVYDITTNSITAQYDGKAAVLTCCWNGNGTKLISGGLDRACVMFDIQTQQIFSLGAHDAAISSSVIGQDQGQDVVFTASWDKTVKLWDIRSKAGTPTCTLNQEDKVFSMDVSGNMLVVALAGRTIQIYDIRNTAQPYQTREASLKHMLRQVRCIPNGTGFVSGSIEGRVSVDYFDPSPEIQSQKFSFKCHREKSNDGTEIIYPVNALAYHPIHQQTFVSGGGDGIVNIWDGSQKKRLRQFQPYPTSISSLSFNKSGSLLAIASSYSFEEGEKDHPSDSIYIRPISDAEVKPKGKAK